MKIKEISEISVQQSKKWRIIEFTEEEKQRLFRYYFVKHNILPFGKSRKEIKEIWLRAFTNAPIKSLRRIYIWQLLIMNGFIKPIKD